MTKLCTKCREVKAPEDFGVNRSSRDGLQSWCKKCRIASNVRRESERIRIDPEFRERRASRMRTENMDPERLRVVRERVARERKEVGSAEWARGLLARAVHRGRVTKPEACEGCGDVPPRHRLHGHHWHGDYANRPLEVRWLCTLCHGDEHRQERAA